jgi:DNA-binding winged helix-turn-helix (wHTH) protein/Tol biopolymer transport system component
MTGKSKRQKRLLAFGPFRVDPDERLLLHNGDVVPLPPKVFETLLLLVRNSGRAMDKGVLMQELWPDTFVEEVNLAQHISLLRKALGESPTEPQYIETIPRRGYRFRAKVDEIVEEPPKPAAAPPVRKTPSARAILLAVFLGGFCAALLLVRVKTWPQRRGISTADYIRITNFTDSAVQPALSPDGKMLTFIRGPNTFITAGEIYAMLLPSGEPVALTRDRKRKLAPAFSPDGAHVAYTTVDAAHAFDTWIVPALGGEPRLLFPNATGLTWLAGGRILFSEILTGMHMAVSTANGDRSATRGIYVPRHERGMAHFSSLSPDGKWVLIVEMDHNGDWMPCRLVPFVGSSKSRSVGPPGRCTAAAWSPDGRQMYFSAAAGGAFHLWRQRRDSDLPEQMTFGPTEEEGIAIAPDGRSLITSIGMRQSAIWIHDKDGDREVSSDGFSSSPSFSPDGRMLYWLRRESVAGPAELWAMDLMSGKRGPALPGVTIEGYDISADGKQVAFATSKDSNKAQIWLAPLDGLAQPRLLTAPRTDSPFFGSPGELIFRSAEQDANFLESIKITGESRRRIVPTSIILLYSVSPDGLWAAARVQTASERTKVAAIAVPLRDGVVMPICSGSLRVKWSPDGRFLYISEISGRNPSRTLVLPIPAGEGLPGLPPGGIRSFEEGMVLPGARVIDQSNVAPGPNPSTYAYARITVHRNVFRIPLP